MKLSLSTRPQFIGQPDGAPVIVTLSASEGPQGPAWDVSFVADSDGHIEAKWIKAALQNLSEIIKP